MLRLYADGAAWPPTHDPHSARELRPLMRCVWGPGDRLCVFDDAGHEHEVLLDRS